MHQKLAVARIVIVSEPVPGVVEIVLKLEEGDDSATLRMSSFTMSDLASKLSAIAGH